MSTRLAPDPLMDELRSLRSSLTYGCASREYVDLLEECPRNAIESDLADVIPTPCCSRTVFARGIIVKGSANRNTATCYNAFVEDVEGCYWVTRTPAFASEYTCVSWTLHI